MPRRTRHLAMKKKVTDRFLPPITIFGGEELEFVEESIREAALNEPAIKQKITARHNKKVGKQEFKLGDFVLQQKQEVFKVGKFATN